MVEQNGTNKAVRIITLLILIAGLLVTFGASYTALNIKINIVEKTANKTDIRSYRNEKAIISIQRDIKYILAGVNELRGK